MRKIISIMTMTLTFALFVPRSSQAQTTGSTSLHIVLNPLLSILVNDPTVTITFAALSDYQNGKSQDQTTHLTVTNIGASTYSVKVAAAAATLGGVTSGNTSTIPVGDVHLTVDGGTTSVGTGSTTNAVTLSNTSSTLISGGPASVAKSLGVTYAIPAVASQMLIGLTPDTYTVTVTYTISNP